MKDEIYTVTYYQSKETGELLTYKEMLADFAENYDGGDDTNACDWQEYYEKVKVC